MRIFRLDGVHPRLDAGFACIDLLPATHKANNDCPILMSVEVGNEKLRLRLIETRSLLLPLHEVGSLLEIPGALRFVEDDDVLKGRPGFDEAVVAKVMYVLNECFHTFPDLALPNALTPAPA